MKVPAALHTGVPRRLLLGGLLGTTLLTVVGIGAGAVPHGRGNDAIATALQLNWLHDDGPVQAVCTIVTGPALLLLVWSWWRLRHLLDDLSPRAVMVVAGLWSLPLLIAPPLFSRDVYAYAGQGHLVAHNIDAYTYGPGDYEPTSKWSYQVDSVWRYSPSPYGPVWLWISGMVLRIVGNHLVPAVILLRFVAVGGLLLVAWALPKIARDHGVPPQRALWLGLANPFILLHGVAGAHNDTLMVGLLMCGIAVVGSAPTTLRLVGAAALITTAALVKLPAVAALGFLPMLMPGWPARFRAAFVVLAAAAVTSVSLTTATGLGWGWLHTLDAGSARLSIFSPLTGVGVLAGNALERVGLVDTPDAVLRIVLAAGFATGGVLSLGLLLRAHRLGPMRALGLTMVAVVALGPIVQPWYLLWGLVLLAAVGNERTLIPLGALSVALCLAIAPTGRSLIRPPLYGAPVLAAVSVATYLVRRSTKQLQDDVEPSTAPLELPA